LEQALGKAERLELRKDKRKRRLLDVFVKLITKPWARGCRRNKKNSKANEKTGRD
jgi:hypothetical protein